MQRLILVIILFISSFLNSLVWADFPQIGDIVIYKGAFNNIFPNRTFEHAGVFVGKIDNSDNIDYVIEFTSENDSINYPVITKTPFSVFISRSPDKKVYKKNFVNIIPHSRELTKAMAIEYLKEGGIRFGSYHAAYNNCQSFAMFCKTGYRESWQFKAINYSVLKPIRAIIPTASEWLDAISTIIDTVDYYQYLPGK